MRRRQLAYLACTHGGRGRMRSGSGVFAARRRVEGRYRDGCGSTPRCHVLVGARAQFASTPERATQGDDREANHRPAPASERHELWTPGLGRSSAVTAIRPRVRVDAGGKGLPDPTLSPRLRVVGPPSAFDQRVNLRVVLMHLGRPHSRWPCPDSCGARTWRAPGGPYEYASIWC